MSARLLAAALALLVAVPAGAQPRTQTAFDLLRLDASARSAALAGPAALAADDPATVFANPALLTSQARGVALGYTDLLAGVRAGSAVYARDIGALSVAGAVRYLSYGEFERRSGSDPTSPSEGTFGANEAAVSLAVAREVAPDLRIGVTGHALFASIDDAGAQALAADVGVTYTVPSEQLVLGASVHHAGAVVSSFGAEGDRLPLDVRLTVSKRLQYVPLTVSLAAIDLQRIEGPSADSSAVNRALDHVALGGELALGGSFAVRAGYNGRRGADLRSGDRLDLAGVSVGAGIRLRRIGVDYAFSNWGRFGGLHQFGVRTRL